VELSPRRYDPAIADRTAAIGTSPGDAAAYHLRAQAYADENEDALALADLDVVDQLGGDGPPKG